MADSQGPIDIYSDNIALGANDWGVVLLIKTVRPPTTQGSAIHVEPDLKAIIRLSHAHAKTITILLKRLLKEYETNAGEIKIPNTVVESQRITPEEWT